MRNLKVIFAVGAMGLAAAVAVACSSSSNNQPAASSGSSSGSASSGSGTMVKSCAPFSGNYCAAGETCCQTGLTGGTCGTTACTGSFNLSVACHDTASCGTGQVCCAEIQGIDAGGALAAYEDS